jgi:hypothetical protein
MQNGAQTTEPKKSRAAEFTHTIIIDDLIVHKFTESEALKRKAHKVAEELIQNELRPGEFMRSPRQGKFQLVFPKLTPEAGDLRCAVLTDLVFREIKKINPAAKEIATIREESVEPPPPKATFASPSSRPSSPASGAARASSGDPHDAEMKRLANDALRHMAGNVPWRLEELVARQSSFLGSDALKLRYHPIWSVPKKHVTGYRVETGRIEVGVADPNFTVGVADILSVVQTGQCLRRMIGNSEVSIIVVPIHFSTLDSSQLRAPLLEALAEGAETFRHYLVCNVINIPKDASRFRLREIIGYLKGRCRHVSARVTLDNLDLDTYASLGYSPIGLNWRDHVLSEQRLMNYVSHLAESAHKLGVATYVSDINSRSGVLCAIASGISHIDGAALHKPFESPLGIRRFELADLYGHELTTLRRERRGLSTDQLENRP